MRVPTLPAISLPLRPRWAFALATALALAACGGEGGGTDVQVPSSVAVSPSASTLVSLGETKQLGAAARDASGGSIPGAGVTFSWSSSDATIASVNGSGLVTAAANGTATITASIPGGATGTAAVTVDQAAAAITLSIDADTLLTGTTAQATAAATDAGGAALGAPDLTWASSDPAVATVDGAGVITGVSDGTATITASQDGASADAALVVVRPNLMVQGDTTLGGMVVVDQLTIMAGTTVTLADDLEIDAKSAVSIAGMLMGDCVAVSIGGAGSVTISGTVNNACAVAPASADDAPALVIDADGGIDLTDANLVSSGAMSLSSTPAAAALGGPASAWRVGRRASAVSIPRAGVISLTRATLQADPATAPEGVVSPSNGRTFSFTAWTEMHLNGTTIRAQHGGPGAAVSETSAEDLDVSGIDGGEGGTILIDLGPTGKLIENGSHGATRLFAGNGGPGGPATAVTTTNGALDVAPNAIARGGAGGLGGTIELNSFLVLVGWSSPDLFEIHYGEGGRGGNATATAADGVAATDDRDAQPGGTAQADAGRGGNVGLFQNDWVPVGDETPKQGGSAGVARATAGDGGDGIRSRPDGATGGDGLTRAGNGGNSYEDAGKTGGDATSEGGNGGNGADVCSAFSDLSLGGQISVASDPASSDPFIFQAGGGISLGVVYRILNSLAGPGGRGGPGGSLVAASGQGGLGRSSEGRAPDGVFAMGSGGNGGRGGAGVGPGAGGPGGSSVGTTGGQQIGPVFQAGASGGSCPSAVSARVEVGGPFATAQADQTIQINGSGAWVNVSGTLSDDGTVTGTGRGTVAGVQNILVEFSGTWDASTSTLIGTYTIDSEKIISAGHPVVYNVNVSGG